MTDLNSRLVCYVINLDRARQRWERASQSFDGSGLNLIRFSAIEGAQIVFPNEEYSEARFRLYHGKRTNPNEVGCFFSHVRVLRMFLDSDKEFALICEDDIVATPEIAEVLRAVLAYRTTWDLVRLNGTKMPWAGSIAALGNGYSLAIPISWFGGTGAYLVGRKGAERILKHILPMRVPYDHALDQNWLMGITTAIVRPFPIRLGEMAEESLIKEGKSYRISKLPFFRRWGVFPYRLTMSLGRFGKQLGSLATRLLFPPKPAPDPTEP